jgi:hypothetical protein
VSQRQALQIRRTNITDASNVALNEASSQGGTFTLVYDPLESRRLCAH